MPTLEEMTRLHDLTQAYVNCGDVFNAKLNAKKCATLGIKLLKCGAR